MAVQNANPLKALSRHVNMMDAGGKLPAERQQKKVIKELVGSIDQMSAKQLREQMLKDAQTAGFKVFNDDIHLPAACDVMEAFQTLKIIWENRAIEPLVRDLNKIKTEVSKVIGDW